MAEARRTCGWLLAWAMLVAWPSTHAAEAAALCPQPLKVALYDIGVFYRPDSGKGIDQDVVAELARRTQCRFHTEFNSRVRIWQMLRNASLDLSVSGIATEERRGFADFVPYYRARNELVVLASTPIPASPEAFLAEGKFKLGVVKSYVHGPGWEEWVAALRAQGRVVELADTAELFRALDHGRVQAIPAWRPLAVAMGFHYGMRHPLVRLRWFADHPDVAYCLVLSKARLSPALRQHIAEQVEAMRRDGFLDSVYRRYMSAADVEAMTLR
jgi:polar amino acid transport system substrate-binding protein